MVFSIFDKQTIIIKLPFCIEELQTCINLRFSFSHINYTQLILKCKNNKPLSGCAPSKILAPPKFLLK